MEKNKCFLCENIGMVNTNFSKTITKYQKIPISSILNEFAENERIKIAIKNTDSICLMCKVILDEYDLMCFELQNVEKIITHKLNRKYKFSKSKLPAIRTSEETLNLFGYKKPDQKFQCKKCTFATDFPDSLFPHRLYHEYAERIAKNEIIRRPKDDFLCTDCQLILTSERLFEQHMKIFHAPMKSSESQNIDLNGAADTDKPQEITYQCNVSLQKSLTKKKTKKNEMI